MSARDDAVAAWEAARDALARDPSAVGAALEAGGRAILAGAEPEGLHEAIGARAIDDALDASGLEDAAIAAIEAIDRRDGAAVLEALEARHSVEARLLAALRCGIEPSPSVHEAIVLFDELVRPHAFRLVRFNTERERRARAVEAAHRPRCWWWCAGVGLEPAALDAFDAVALLVARFEEAQRAFDGLVEVARAWAGSGRVATLASWVRRGGAAHGELALAAAPEDERTLLERDEVHVSWLAPGTLIVDRIAEGGPPVLRVGDEERTGVPVEGAIDRYAFAIDLEREGEIELELHVPLASGLLVLRLPP